MKRKSAFRVRPCTEAKRILVVANSRAAAERHAGPLRDRGYIVTSAHTVEYAIAVSRTEQFDVILVTLRQSTSSEASFCALLKRVSPHAAIVWLIDPSKPLPAVPCQNLMWTEEQDEYFVARVDALAATA